MKEGFRKCPNCDEYDAYDVNILYLYKSIKEKETFLSKIILKRRPKYRSGKFEIRSAKSMIFTWFCLLSDLSQSWNGISLNREL